MKKRIIPGPGKATRDAAHQTGEKLVDIESLVETSPPADGALRVGKLHTLWDVREELARLYRSARRTAGKEVDASDAAKLGFLLTSIGRTIVDAELERRLDALEGRLAQK